MEAKPSDPMRHCSCPFTPNPGDATAHAGTLVIFVAVKYCSIDADTVTTLKQLNLQQNVLAYKIITPHFRGSSNMSMKTMEQRTADI